MRETPSNSWRRPRIYAEPVLGLVEGETRGLNAGYNAQPYADSPYFAATRGAMSSTRSY